MSQLGKSLPAFARENLKMARVLPISTHPRSTRVLSSTSTDLLPVLLMEATAIPHPTVALQHPSLHMGRTSRLLRVRTIMAMADISHLRPSHPTAIMARILLMVLLRLGILSRQVRLMERQAIVTLMGPLTRMADIISDRAQQHLSIAPECTADRLLLPATTAVLWRRTSPRPSSPSPTPCTTLYGAPSVPATPKGSSSTSIASHPSTARSGTRAEPLLPCVLSSRPL
ncbi:unnamed protein product [Parascedosporium putredinis]|uniref:Uncharacterized protein n=1 Tax=Parascedosporium putredinis TaxID=1442378 RepID=A0A9P1GVT5_9PEZI|nr:unnamed protein product [Parascedosporium putredinis]CAI7987976.1 unnamed protein product [Parascedosporium putredinis]